MAQNPLFSSHNPNYMSFLSSAQNTDGLAGTTLPNATNRSYRLSDIMNPSSPQASSTKTYGTTPTYGSTLPDNVAQQPVPTTGADPSLLNRLRSWSSSYGRNEDGEVNAEGSPLVRDATALGGIGLGVASFLEQRKTAGLQRQALRHDIATAKEHRANRQALGDSWNSAWGN